MARNTRAGYPIRRWLRSEASGRPATRRDVPMREPTIMRERLRRVPTAAGPAAGAPEDPGVLLQHIARGDEASFERLYDVVISPVFGLVRRVVRDPAQSEEVVQEVMVELWRTAAR